MAKTVGDFVLERLAVWGVRRLFGYPGDGINGIITALAARMKSISSRFGMKKRPHLWLPATPN